MKAWHSLSRVSCTFDEPNLVPAAGLIAPAVLCERVGLAQLVADSLSVPGPCGANSAAKALTVLGGMLAGADSIDDLDVLRSGATPELFNDLRAPSTLGSWLRSFSPGNVRQLDAVSRELRARLWDAGAGPHRRDERFFLDVDSTIAACYGTAKQGVSFGYTKARGYHPLIATVHEPGAAPDVLHVRLREGKANTARGAASFVAESVSRLCTAGVTGEIVARFDGGFYNGKVVSACRRADVRFSVGVRNDTRVGRAIAAIGDEDWTPIPYWNSEVDPDTGQLIASHAEVAETSYTAFAGKHRVTARLVVRRVRRLRPRTGQLELDTDIWRHHAILTDRSGPLLMVEAEHRDHAIVEQVIADLKAGPLAHLPSGDFHANAAWLALAALAHNLTRALGILAAHRFIRATTATIRDNLIKVPGRLVRSARRRHLRLAEQWPWQTQIERARRRIDAMPLRT